jgi:TrmH family RNA methyltransferase
MKRITSDANASYRRWLKLATQPRAVRELGISIAEGEHLALAVLEAGVPIDAALVRAGSGNDRLLARLPAQAPLFELSAALFDRLGLVERGIGFAVVFAVPPEASGPAVGDLVYLDGVQEPGNVGALLRVAAAAGVPQVWAGPGTAALWAPKVLRGAQGAHFGLALREGVNATELRRHFRGRLCAATATQATPLWQTDLAVGALGWVFGAEGQGVSDAALAACDARVMIPLAAGVESLNVATAAAVCLFERQRRRIAAGTNGT